ncbi:MAG: RidA family protein, partial [Bryobacteraceae bacterium]
MKAKLVLKVAGLIGVLALISAGYCFWLMTVPLSYDRVPVVLSGFVLATGVFVISLTTSFIVLIRLRRSPRAAKCSADRADHLTSRLNHQSLMPKEYVNPNSLFPSLPHGFSQVVIASGRKMVFVSGQAAWDARKNIVGGDSVLEQARQAFRNLEKAMEAAGATLRDIVALRIYVVDYQAESGTAVGTAVREFFSKGNPPTSTWIGVSALADPEFLIEIEAT